MGEILFLLILYFIFIKKFLLLKISELKAALFVFGNENITNIRRGCQWVKELYTKCRK